MKMEENASNYRLLGGMRRSTKLRHVRKHVTLVVMVEGGGQSK